MACAQHSEVGFGCDEVFRAPGWSAVLLHLHFSVAKGLVGWGEDFRIMTKNGESKPHVEGRHMDRVSSAVWPANARKGVATGKAAQRRRDWIMHGRWWVILVDTLSMRLLFIMTTAMVVVCSLAVAFLGLNFWYLLLIPLLIFAALALLPSFLASRASAEIAPPALAAFAQEFRSSAGIFSSGPLEHTSVDLPALEAPTTPMPGEQPLVRVLETYDLSQTPIEHFLRPEGETDELEAIAYPNKDFWEQTPGPRPLNTIDMPSTQTQVTEDLYKAAKHICKAEE